MLVSIIGTALLMVGLNLTYSRIKERCFPYTIENSRDPDVVRRKARALPPASARPVRARRRAAAAAAVCMCVSLQSRADVRVAGAAGC